MSTQLSVSELQAQLESMKLLLKQAKQSTRVKTPVTAVLHTAKDSGKLSIALGQGFRKAYLNADQIMFILNNQDEMAKLMSALKA